jgi:hypothetical protein
MPNAKCNRIAFDKPFDEGETFHLGGGLCLERCTLQQLAFQCGEEALRHGVVVAIANGTRGRLNTSVSATLTEGNGCVLAALVEG